MKVLMLASLASFSVVASQPLFYLMALGHAQRTLPAPAYIELRQHINAVMNRRIPWAYASALATVLGTLLVAFRAGATLVAGTAAIALVCLVVDAWCMLREAVPINGVIDGWSPTAYPPDWETYRIRWFAIFRWRQVVLLAGLGALLVGAVYGS
jgi:hypothetical protein